jgi:serine phosphatase RsbU (regulator of sigma subunit)
MASAHQMAVIIGDVSGNGTSAAFHMAQLKGVFHSLVEIDLSAGDFLRYANKALSRCLEKNQFITTSFFNIDTASRKIQYARAGHCPTLYFSYTRQQAYYLQDKGMGLAIVRNNDYNQHIFMHELKYEPGDAMLLYTDGIVEAKNSINEEYGYDRLTNFMKVNNNLPVQQFIDKLVDEILAFCNYKVLADDYTAILIKFI